MKTLFLFLSLFTGVVTFCQTIKQELKNNTWYLDYIVINGNSNTPPTNQEIPYINLDFSDTDLFISTYCNYLAAGVEIQQNFYEFLEPPYQFLEDCDSPPGVMTFESLYFDFFREDSDQPFDYEIITEANSDKTLIITSVSGDEAVYSNQNPLSIKENPQFAFRLYPNPTKTHFIIQTGGMKIEEVGIYSLNGKEVLHFEQSSIYDISRLQKGMYFVKIKSKQGILIKKIIKE